MGNSKNEILKIPKNILDGSVKMLWTSIGYIMGYITTETIARYFGVSFYDEKHRPSAGVIFASIGGVIGGSIGFEYDYLFFKRFLMNG